MKRKSQPKVRRTNKLANSGKRLGIAAYVINAQRDMAQTPEQPQGKPETILSRFINVAASAGLAAAISTGGVGLHNSGQQNYDQICAPFARVSAETLTRIAARSGIDQIVDEAKWRFVDKRICSRGEPGAWEAIKYGFIAPESAEELGFEVEHAAPLIRGYVEILDNDSQKRYLNYLSTHAEFSSFFDVRAGTSGEIPRVNAPSLSSVSDAEANDAGDEE